MSISEESDILKIVKEDVLRILGERQQKVILEEVTSEIGASNSIISTIMRHLEDEKLIQVDENFIRLTKKGRNEAKAIVKRHQILEQFLKDTRNEREAHQAAHLLEHYVSEEVTNNIKKLSTLKKEGVSLPTLGLHTESIITNISLSDYGLFERIVSMGIFPGETITITNETPHAIIVKIRNKKFALDKNVAKKIGAVSCEKA